MTDIPALEAHGLTKTYRRRPVLHDLTFTVPQGSTTGFLGPNGAGKSTTMRLLLGLERPDGGRALVRGRPLGAWERPGEEVGAALSDRCAHPGRSALDSLRWVALLLGRDERHCRDALDRVGLGAVADRRTGTFSQGMRRRLALATALLGDPRTLVLDEPMNGLDPEGVAWLRDLLQDLRREGRTVLLSSHLLRELEDLVDDIVVITDGRLVEAGPMADFLARHEGSTVVVRCEDVHGLVQAVTAAGGQLRGQVHRDRVTFVGLDAKEVNAVARAHAIVLDEISTERRLESAYRSATEGAGR